MVRVMIRVALLDDHPVVLAGLLPDSMGALLHGLRQYGFIILYALLFTGVLWDLVGPPYNFIRGLLL